jgi:hypothetical protein
VADPTASDLAAQIAAAYILAEQQLLAGATAVFARTTATTAGRLDAIAAIRALASRIAHSLAAQTPAIQAMVAAATNDGRRTASAQVSKALATLPSSGSGGRQLPPPPGSGLALPDDPFDLTLRHGERAAQAIARDLTSSLDDVRRRITRLPDDIYKAIAPHGAIYGVSPNEFTSAQAQAAAWRVFVSQGVRGFTDVSGRDWSLSAYVEMAVRTASARAYNTSHLERMNALGIHYFTIPAHPGSCPLCFPWQGALLSDDATDDPDATPLSVAIAAGLFHPNCEHTLIPVFPGVTVLHPLEWTDAHAQAFAVTQKQRRLELEVRKAKRRLEYAYEAESRQIARKDIVGAQQRLREFVNATPGTHRQSRREQLDLRDGFAKLPTPIR